MFVSMKYQVTLPEVGSDEWNEFLKEMEEDGAFGDYDNWKELDTNWLKGDMAEWLVQKGRSSKYVLIDFNVWEK